MRKIVIYPAGILRQKTEEIKNIDERLLEEMDDLKNILKNGENAAGLAAPQIGVSKRFFGSKELSNREPLIFINPKIEKSYGGKVYPKIVGENKKEEDFLEGCLSFPKYFGTVKRFLEIDVSWDEIEEEKLVRKNRKLGGFEAIVWQHESDHLDGIVFIDHIKKDGGKLYKEIKGEMFLQSKIDFI
ncbi:MAG: peptide deformylase [Candidatus Shapirobacteria bacterium]|jgi:peptide deformylase